MALTSNFFPSLDMGILGLRWFYHLLLAGLAGYSLLGKFGVKKALSILDCWFGTSRKYWTPAEGSFTKKCALGWHSGKKRGDKSVNPSRGTCSLIFDEWSLEEEERFYRHWWRSGESSEQDLLLQKDFRSRESHWNMYKAIRGYPFYPKFFPFVIHLHFYYLF